jgi:pSer/pThr/pTyr-binding forkhead associated (FHA) protein
MRSWIIGNGAECDVIVDSPLVSSRHCQLSQTGDDYILEDLGSTNGTYVDGLRIMSSIRVTPRNEITLGRTVPMPWPAEAMRYISIGRVTGNDIVLDDPRVSSRHARLIVVAGSQTLIEDLGSSNGTFLNSPERRVIGAVPLLETDVVCFGTFTIPAAQLLSRSIAAETAIPPSAPVLSPSPPVSGPLSELTPGRPMIATSMVNPWIGVLLAKTLVLAVLVVLFFGRHAAVPIDLENWSSVGQAIASTTFALALLAIWLGCSVATLETVAERSRGEVAHVGPSKNFVSLCSRLLVPIGLCALGCALALAIVYWGSGLRGSLPAMWGMMVMASAVGLFLGLVVNVCGRSWIVTPLVLLLCFAPMIALGGRVWPLADLKPPFPLAAAAMPSRWAFEGLLLLETVHSSARVMPEGTDLAKDRDLAETYFPIGSERMGPAADATALVSMLIGMAGLLGFMVSRPSRSDPLTA